VTDVLRKRFDSPDEVRTFEKGKLGTTPYVSLHFLGAETYAKK
jgi:hypothetical protein